MKAISRDLLQLCELQLESILAEIDTAVLSVSRSATESLGLCDGLDGQEREGDSVPRLRAGLDNIVTRLQFHDELSQRIQHTRQLLSLLRQGDAAVPDDAAGAIRQLSAIFSVRAEFGLMQEVFPGYRLPEPGNSVELF